MTAADREDLPFDVAVERLPAWSLAASGLVVAACVLVALRWIPMLAVLPFLVASSLGRRFASAPTHVEVRAAELSIGARTLSRDAIVDVWVDEDASDPIGVVAHGGAAELVVLHFDNPEQAARFGAALRDTGGRPVLGHRVRPLDLVPSLRFAALAMAFAATGSPYGLLLLAVFGVSTWPLFQAKQLVTTEKGFEIRSLFGTEARAYADVRSVDVEAGSIALADGSEVALPRSSLRDVALTSAPWLERARTRALVALRDAARSGR